MFSKRLAGFRFIKNVLSGEGTFLATNNVTLKYIRNRSTFIHDISKEHSQAFFSDSAQKLMKQMTGLDLDKVFRKRAVGGKLTPPKYEFMTNEQLREAQERAVRKGYAKLQMPPMVPVNEGELKVIEEVPQMIGYTKSNYVFTDITFNVTDRERLIVVREPSGVLRKALPFERHRMNSIYFPRPGRSYTHPKMFQEENISRLLREGQYEFILDRACAQFEPDDKEFHEVVFSTFDKINDDKAFDTLRSTRHFGPLTFYLCVAKNVSKLLEEMLETERMPDAVSLAQLYCIVNPTCKFNSLNLDQNDKIEYLKGFIQSECPSPDKLLQIVDTYWETQKALTSKSG